MSLQVTLVLLFTFVIRLVGTISYALRIAGVRTGRIAVSLSLFNLWQENNLFSQVRGVVYGDAPDWNHPGPTGFSARC